MQRRTAGSGIIVDLLLARPAGRRLYTHNHKKDGIIVDLLLARPASRWLCTHRHKKDGEYKNKIVLQPLSGIPNFESLISLLRLTTLFYTHAPIDRIAMFYNFAKKKSSKTLGAHRAKVEEKRFKHLKIVIVQYFRISRNPCSVFTYTNHLDFPINRFPTGNTHDQELFSFHRDHSPCDGFEEVLNLQYNVFAQLLRLSEDKWTMNVPAVDGGLLKPDVVEGTDDESDTVDDLREKMADIDNHVGEETGAKEGDD
ncbi:hypothetical protein Syun_022967 [Stephania yunnanensis]|uniref:Uncharacterized protein n=1 Tax=Stephania yunnanensis TaxID=152371 RepID=A0AAP0F827_9MAGN